MKNFSWSCLILAFALPAVAATTPSSAPAKPATSKTHTSASAGNAASAVGKPAVVAAPSTAPGAASAPAPTPASKTGGMLDDYIQALATAVPLSKDEQANIKICYLDDGAKLQGILNNPALSPLQQTQQVDALRDMRNDTIEALLNDAGRRQKFLQVEANYRVALVVLAADGGLVPASAPAPASAPKPTSTPPAPADQLAPAT